MAHFIVYKKTLYATNMVYFYLEEIVKLYGIPKTIVSNWDLKFLSYF